MINSIDITQDSRCPIGSNKCLPWRCTGLDDVALVIELALQPAGSVHNWSYILSYLSVDYLCVFISFILTLCFCSIVASRDPPLSIPISFAINSLLICSKVYYLKSWYVNISISKRGVCLPLLLFNFYVLMCSSFFDLNYILFFRDEYKWRFTDISMLFGIEYY